MVLIIAGGAPFTHRIPNGGISKAITWTRDGAGRSETRILVDHQSERDVYRVYVREGDTLETLAGELRTVLKERKFYIPPAAEDFERQLAEQNSLTDRTLHPVHIGTNLNYTIPTGPFGPLYH